MKPVFCLLVVLFCSLTFAQTDKGNETLTVLLSEKKCIENDKERISITIKTEREEKTGSDFYGVTSHGDVAFIENNNTIHLYLCQRSAPASVGSLLKKISTVNDASSCSVGEILAMDVILNGSTFIPFRSIRFDETSLCHSLKDKKVNNSRDNALKEADSSLQKAGKEAKATKQ